ncbi:MAG: magnesium transporter [Legionellaceae bacterium]|nr:magnesium transporter [Legionellaceae bacterium]HAF87758.1 magnesium transporter [Legionellales bacterium]|tara:strand:+ start:1943 stop:2917 length:975 start_codon:yes stop_codon:yes gene_type:complete
MIIAYAKETHFKPRIITETQKEDIKTAVWLDLLNPTKAEEQAIESADNVNIPTLEEMREIELSSRLYVENQTLFMTAVMVAQSDSMHPRYDAVTFALKSQQLITIRYIEPQAFKLVTHALKPHLNLSATEIFLLLLEASIDRLADVLEYVGHGLDACSHDVFGHHQQASAQNIKPDYQEVMQIIGRKSNLSTKARESLVTFTRLITFFKQTAHSRIDKNHHARLITLTTDISSLTDYANFISNKINFLLDATLGMINIEQSAIIKIFSVAAVIFLPPTLIASIYGMNFQYMPELSYKGGYYAAIILMMISAWLPYKYFKYRRWL